MYRVCIESKKRERNKERGRRGSSAQSINASLMGMKESINSSSSSKP